MHYDMVIVGGGLVGASLAIALKQSGLSIALLDARTQEGEDPRLFALNASSCQFLNNLGLWEALAMDASPIHQVHVSRQGRFGSVRLNHHDAGLPSLGHVVPAKKIESVLHDGLLDLPHLDLYQPAVLKTLEHQTDDISLTVSTHDGIVTLSSPIVVGADGADSTVRQASNIAAHRFDYKQSALVTRCQLQRPHQHIAYERFNAKGAIAMLPLTNDQCACIWTADTETIQQLTTLSDTGFLQILQKEFGYRLGKLCHIAKRHQFPLHKLQAENKAARGILLLGNAAHTLHPIAAQGFNLALYEVAALVETILERKQKNEPLNASVLAQFSDMTLKQQTVSTALSHRLSQLFLSDSAFMNAFLQLGMVGFDIASPIKKSCIEAVLGKSNRPPRLLLNND